MILNDSTDSSLEYVLYPVKKKICNLLSLLAIKNTQK